jgi:hypothetical protein
VLFRAASRCSLSYEIPATATATDMPIQKPRISDAEHSAVKDFVRKVPQWLSENSHWPRLIVEKSNKVRLKTVGTSVAETRLP